MSTVSNSTSELLLTAEEFAERPDPGYPEELVKGKVVAMPPPKARHGFSCAEVVFFLRSYLQDHDVGHVFANDAGVITERGPDSGRAVPTSPITPMRRFRRDRCRTATPSSLPT